MIRYGLYGLYSSFSVVTFSRIQTYPLPAPGPAERFGSDRQARLFRVDRDHQLPLV